MMVIGPNELEAMLGFVVREKRFLRQSETSFTSKQLRAGETIARSIVRALDKANGGGARAALRGLPAASIVKPKHVTIVQKHYPVFKIALLNGKGSKKAPKHKSDHRDLYYVPRAHEYR